MPRRTHPLLLIAALAVGLLLAVGVAACGGGSQSAGTLETPPLTVGTGATLPSAASTSTTTTGTTSTTSTTDATADTGGAVDTGDDTGGAVDTGDADTGGDTGADTGGGTAPDTGGGGTTTPAEPANPGGAAPDYQSFCNENPGAC